MKSLPSKRHLYFHQDDDQLCTLVKSQPSESSTTMIITIFVLCTLAKSQAFKSLFAYDILQVQLYNL
jgi:hypothetical protein